MIDNINNQWLFLSILIFVLITFFSVLIQKDSINKLVILFFNLSFYLYSGYGISSNMVEKKFYFYFFTFIIVLNLTFALLSRIEIFSRGIYSYNKFDLVLLEGKMVSFLVILFFITLLIPLLLPQFRLTDIISPPAPSTSRLFELRRLSSSGNNMLYLSKTIQLLLLPFFFVYLAKIVKRFERIKVVLVYISYVYLKYLEYCYISRNEMVGYLVIFTIILFSIILDRRVRIFIILTILILMVVSIPFFVNYQMIRIGGQIVNASYLDMFKMLISSEGFYPIYYSQILNNPISISPIQYILWFIFLVVPSKILPFKPSIAINDIFTYNVSGLRFGDYLYSIQLPSILGESMILYGEYFFWMHAIFLGAFSSLVVSFYKRYPSLRLWLVYIVIAFVKVPRGGSQGFLSEILNGSLGILAYYCIDKFIFTKKGNSGNEIIEKNSYF